MGAANCKWPGGDASTQSRKIRRLKGSIKSCWPHRQSWEEPPRERHQHKKSTGCKGRAVWEGANGNWSTRHGGEANLTGSMTKSDFANRASKKEGIEEITVRQRSRRRGPQSLMKTRRARGASACSRWLKKPQENKKPRRTEIKKRGSVGRDNKRPYKTGKQKESCLD